MGSVPSALGRRRRAPVRVGAEPPPAAPRRAPAATAAPPLSAVLKPRGEEEEEEEEAGGPAQPPPARRSPAARECLRAGVGGTRNRRGSPQPPPAPCGCRCLLGAGFARGQPPGEGQGVPEGVQGESPPWGITLLYRQESRELV